MHVQQATYANELHVNVQHLHGYLRESTEWMLQAALKEKVIVEEEGMQDDERRRNDERDKNWKEEALHREFAQ